MQLFRSFAQLGAGFIAGTLVCVSGAFLIGLVIGAPVTTLLEALLGRAVNGPADPALLLRMALSAVATLSVGLLIGRATRVYRNFTASGFVGMTIGATIGYVVFGTRGSPGLAMSVYDYGAAGFDHWSSGGSGAAILLVVPLLMAYPLMLWGSRRRLMKTQPGQLA